MADGKKLLLIPEDAVVPNGIEADIIVLQMPLSNLLVSNSPAVSLINACGGVDRISMVTIERDSWYIEEVVDKMDENEIVFVGNYRSPDYEVIAKKNPPLTIIHTSVTPDNIAKFDELGLPYIVDASSNENYAMARVEWVKLYGALLGLDEEAQKVYDDQVDIVNSLAGASTGKTVAVFYITSKGPVCEKRWGLHGGDDRSGWRRICALRAEPRQGRGSQDGGRGVLCPLQGCGLRSLHRRRHGGSSPVNR